VTPRNIDPVSEANVSRKFSKTVIEPFGYTGMPTLNHDLIAHRNEICNTINAYSHHMTKVRPDMPTNYVIQQVEYIASGHGVTAKCNFFKFGTGNRRIFIVNFKAPWYPNECSFGFGIGTD
jgi:hypothetical protein